MSSKGKQTQKDAKVEAKVEAKNDECNGMPIEFFDYKYDEKT